MDCTSKCRSRQHVQRISDMMRVAESLEGAKAAVMSCPYALRGVDMNGRTLLHTAASIGRKG